MDDQLTELQRYIESRINQIYTETTLDHAMNPRNVGIMRAADGWAKYTGPCGDTMQIWIKVAGGKVESISFATDGCGTAIACGSMVTEMARGKNVYFCQEIEQQDILDALGDLPEESRHCALLAATTLNMAIEDFLKRREERPKESLSREGG
jgi:nitrogen fixation NifU-like protein